MTKDISESSHYSHNSDEGVNVAILKGLQISRSQIYWFKHNDMEDLERILDQIKSDDAKVIHIISEIHSVL